MTIITYKAARERGLRFYYTGRPCKNGHISVRYTNKATCVSCAVEQADRWRKANPAKRSAIRRKSQARHAEKHRQRGREWRQSNPDKANQRMREWRQKNPDKAKAMVREYKRRNRPLLAALAAKRRSRKINACPAWVDQTVLRTIYKACPVGYHVDHVIPLLGVGVCGLHVPWNLQYLLAVDNVRKGNRIDA